MDNLDPKPAQHAQTPPENVEVDRFGKRASKRFLKSLKSTTSILANLAVILGLVFAAGQILQFRAQERVRLAVDATALVYSPKFLAAITNVTEAYKRGTEVPQDDLIFVTNVYDSIAVLYLRGVADGAIIRSRIGRSVPRLLSILKQENWPEHSTENLRRMVHELEISEQPQP